MNSFIKTFIKTFISTAITCVFIIIILLVVLTPKCKHEETGMMFSFASQNSTAYSYKRPYCKECGEVFSYTNFKGTPNDLSYLDAIKERSDSDEIVGGEYYTVTAVVTLGDYNYGSKRVSVQCKIENEDVKVGFTIDFKEEFGDAVKLLKKGDEITFRGRYYDIGCGFTDCELISNEVS